MTVPQQVSKKAVEPEMNLEMIHVINDIMLCSLHYVSTHFSKHTITFIVFSFYVALSLCLYQYWGINECKGNYSMTDESLKPSVTQVS